MIWSQCSLCQGDVLSATLVAGECAHCIRRRKNREYQRQYMQRPEVKEKARERKRRYRKRKEVKERALEYQRQYRQRPEVQRRAREHNRTAEEKEKNRRYKQVWRNRQRAVQ